METLTAPSNRSCFKKGDLIEISGSTTGENGYKLIKTCSGSFLEIRDLYWFEKMWMKTKREFRSAFPFFYYDRPIIQKIYQIESDGTLTGSFTTSVSDDPHTKPQGVSVAPDGTLYVCD